MFGAEPFGQRGGRGGGGEEEEEETVDEVRGWD